MLEIIKKENILVNQEPRDWEDSITLVGEVLENAGSIENAYTQAMIAAVKQHGPYIVIGKHFAIAHAAPEVYVRNNDMAVAILAKPVDFGSQNDPVKVLFAIASVDGKSHLEKLMELVRIVSEDEGIINHLSECTTKEAVYAIINGENNGRVPLSHRKGSCVE